MTCSLRAFIARENPGKFHLRQSPGLLVVVVGVLNRDHSRAERPNQMFEHASAEKRAEHLHAIKGAKSNHSDCLYETLSRLHRGQWHERFCSAEERAEQLAA